MQDSIEKERFERVYQKYKLIVSMPFGTISAKCFQNNIECLSYNYPFTLTNKNSYLQANTFLAYTQKVINFKWTRKKNKRIIVKKHSKKTILDIEVLKIYENNYNRRSRVYRFSFSRVFDKKKHKIIIIDNLSTGRIENIKDLKIN